MLFFTYKRTTTILVLKQKFHIWGSDLLFQNTLCCKTAILVINRTKNKVWVVFCLLYYYIQFFFKCKIEKSFNVWTDFTTVTMDYYLISVCQAWAWPYMVNVRSYEYRVSVPSYQFYILIWYVICLGLSWANSCYTFCLTSGK